MPHPPPALNLHPWEDPYTLGAFCVKSNLTTYARRTVRFLRRGTNQRAELFYKGTLSAPNISWADLAFEIRTLRDHNPQAFDSYMAHNLTAYTLQRMMQAVHEAHDWETDAIRRTGNLISQVARGPKPHPK